MTLPERPADMSLEDWIATAYGSWAIWLEHPELGPKIREWAEKGATPSFIERELRNTQWWNDTYVNQREWDRRVAEDPRTAERDVDETVQMVRQVASNIGGILDDETAVQLATQQLRDGWRPDELVRAIYFQLRQGTDPTQSLRMGIVGQSVQQIARQFAMPLSDATLDSWVTRIATNEYLLEDFTNFARQTAMGMFPSLAADIQRGMNVETLVDPYREMAARTLEINPGTIDFSDPKWNTALNFGDENGRRMMTLSEWGRHLRETPEYGYEYTSQAHNRAYQVAESLGRMFGRL